jgi:starch synthase
MYILMLSAECAPLAKAGGLGDFVQGLAHELAAQGERVEILLPKYDCLHLDRIWDLHKIQDLWVPCYDDWVHCDVEQGQTEGLTCLLIDAHAPQGWFRRGRIHGEPDDPERFAFFCRAALEFLFKGGRRPDVLHCQDWHTGLVPVLLQQLDAPPGSSRPRVCCTLHNVAYQGRCGEHILHLVGLESSPLMTEGRLRDATDPSRINLMQGGIVYADYVTTVSPRYAWEILYGDLGMGLAPVLRERAERFGGVLNGIDYEVWSPETDPAIAHTYCADTLQRKARNKAALRERLGLEQAARPLVGVVSRLEPQKGPELMRHAADFAPANGAQLVLLGSAQDPDIGAAFEAQQRRLVGHPHCRLELRYDEELAHQIFAGADLILVPSRFEPCGLTQLIAMRYGAVPVARRVGGLADTVIDANYSDHPFEERNGYLFDDYSESDLESALRRAIGLWSEHPAYFRQLRRNGMAQDHSWRAPARRYLDIFAHICG